MMYQTDVRPDNHYYYIIMRSVDRRAGMYHAYALQFVSDNNSRWGCIDFGSEHCFFRIGRKSDNMKGMCIFAATVFLLLLLVVAFMIHDQKESMNHGYGKHKRREAQYCK